MTGSWSTRLYSIFEKRMKGLNVSDRDISVTMLKDVVRSKWLKKLYVPIYVVSDTKLDHWGLLILSSRQEKLEVSGGALEWGYSLHHKPYVGSTGLLMGLFRKIVRDTFPAVRWSVSGRNCMEKKKYKIQMDGYSCGFYVLAYIYSCSKGSEFLPMMTFRKPDPVAIRRLRYGAVSAYLSANLAAQEAYRDNVTHLDVMRGIHAGLLITKMLEVLEDMVDVYQAQKEKQEPKLGDRGISECINLLSGDENVAEG